MLDAVLGGVLVRPYQCCAGKKSKRERGKEVKKRSKSCDRSDGGRSAAQPAESRGSEKEHPVFAKLLRKARRHISRIRYVSAATTRKASCVLS